MEGYIKADGFDKAIIGIDTIGERIIYCKQKMIEILSQEMNKDEAIELLEFNTRSYYIGKHTPVYIDRMSGEDFESLMNG